MAVVLPPINPLGLETANQGSGFQLDEIIARKNRLTRRAEIASAGFIADGGDSKLPHLRQQSLAERRSSLKALLGTDERSRIQFSDEFVGDGDALFKACAEQELEGIVSKHALAPYRSGRSKTWLKTKCFTQSTFVVIGTDRDRKTGALRALLAHKDSAGLSYAGAAFIALVLNTSSFLLSLSVWQHLGQRLSPPADGR